MNKKRIYLIAPIVFLVVFILYYWNFSSQYDAKQAAIVAKAKAEKLEKLNQEAEQRAAAIKDAVIAQQQRKLERQQREERDRKQKDDKENALLERDKSFQEAEKLDHEVDKLTKDVSAAKDDIAKVQGEEKRSDEELAFLKNYISQAQANQSKLADVIAKIEAADAAQAKAAAAAAAAAAKKNQ